LLQTLISSRVRVKLLTLFLMHPDQEHHLKGLVRELDENNNALRRELNRLERIGLLDSQRKGRAKLYRTNRQHPIYLELRAIILKTTGLGQILRDEIANLGQIDFAFIYGSYAEGEDDTWSDIDLLIVGQVDLENLRRLLQDLEQRLGREINETVYSPQEFALRRRQGDAFLQRVMEGAKIVLVGDVDAFN